MSVTLRHLVVVMARGDSARMGRPKGLVTLKESAMAMVNQVLGLYQGETWQKLLVVRKQDKEAYAGILLDGDVPILAADGGGDTALTLSHALEWIRDHGPDTTHLWAHPVDLPLVAPATVATLKRAVDARPERALRPRWEGRPGHPVVLPVATLGRALQGADLNHSMGEVWRAASRRGQVQDMATLMVEDPGVCRDFDAPDPQLETSSREEEK